MFLELDAIAEQAKAGLDVQDRLASIPARKRFHDDQLCPSSREPIARFVGPETHVDGFQPG